MISSFLILIGVLLLTLITTLCPQPAQSQLVLFAREAIPVSPSVSQQDVMERSPRISMSIALFGCVTKTKYSDQLVDCYYSWIKVADMLGVTTKIFVGEMDPSTPEILKPYIVELHCGDDYMSSTPKHWKGLEYMFNNHPADWYYTCGSDTYLQVHHMAELLDYLDPTQSLYVGGHGDVRIWGSDSYYFHGGGPGYVFSHVAMEKIAKNTNSILTEYFTFPDTPQEFQICDVQAGYVADKLGITCVKIKDRFFDTSPRERPTIDMGSMIACHQMLHVDFLQFNV